jgi:hypothetical protein
VAYRIKLAKQIETLTTSVHEYLCIRDPGDMPGNQLGLFGVNRNGEISTLHSINNDDHGIAGADADLPEIEYYCYGLNPNEKKERKTSGGKKKSGKK